MRPAAWRRAAILGILTALIAVASAQTAAQIETWIASATALSQVSGWSLVRYLPAAATSWHFATDDLKGTEAYTTAESGNGGWSVVFPEFDEFFISSADFSKWVHFPQLSIA